MATQPISTAAQPATAIAAPRSARSITKRWLFAAFLLAGAAQLITISALLGADPLPATWSPLLLAIAPAPLAAAAAFTPPALARLAVVAAAVAMLVGIFGGIGRTGTLFIPALIALVIGGLRLWLAESR
jgi:hypothetical protein